MLKIHLPGASEENVKNIEVSFKKDDEYVFLKLKIFWNSEIKKIKQKFPNQVAGNTLPISDEEFEFFTCKFQISEFYFEEIIDKNVKNGVILIKFRNHSIDQNLEINI